MNEDFKEEKANASAENGESRDGFTPTDNYSPNSAPKRFEGGKRPRFVSRNAEGYGSYSGNRYGNHTNEGYNRPRYDRNAPGEYRPRPRYNAEGGNPDGYAPRRYGEGQGGYGRPNRYGYGRPGSYQREGYDRSAKGGYNRRPAGREGFYGDEGHRGNFAPRYNRQGEGGYTPRQQGYRPRYGQGGYNGGYGQRPRRDEYDPHAKYSMKKRLEYKEEHFDPDAPIRLNKYLANAGICSRRDADKYIQAGVVTVNGEIVTELGAKVKRTDTVLFHDNAVSLEKKVYVLLNKPKGYVTTSEDPQNRKTVMDLVRDACPERIYPIGRLDRNTTGVLLLTNDGEMASKLTHPKFLKKKIYHVYTDKNVTAADMQRIAEGLTLEDGEIKVDAIEYASPTDKKQVGIEIHSGKNRIVRRIFASLGYQVVKLDRVYFAGLTKKNVRRGDWRFLTEKEVSMLRMGAYE